MQSKCTKKGLRIVSTPLASECECVNVVKFTNYLSDTEKIMKPSLLCEYIGTDPKK